LYSPHDLKARGQITEAPRSRLSTVCLNTYVRTSQLTTDPFLCLEAFSLHSMSVCALSILDCNRRLLVLRSVANEPFKSGTKSVGRVVCKQYHRDQGRLQDL